jgi:hypothetical protein
LKRKTPYSEARTLGTLDKKEKEWYDFESTAEYRRFHYLATIGKTIAAPRALFAFKAFPNVFF